jgi:hypothetical protein
MTEGKFIPGNQSANTPDLRETELRGMKMQQLIELAEQEGIPEIDHMRRDDLIRAISARHREGQTVGGGGQGQGQTAGGGQRQGDGEGQARDGGQGQTAGQQAGGGQSQTAGQQAGGGQSQATEGKFMPGNQSANTPDLSETELRGMQMPQLQEIARQEGIQGVDQMRRDDLIKEISNRYRERQLHPQR